MGYQYQELIQGGAGRGIGLPGLAAAPSGIYIQIL